MGVVLILLEVAGFVFTLCITLYCLRKDEIPVMGWLKIMVACVLWILYWIWVASVWKKFGNIKFEQNDGKNKLGV